MCLPETLFTTLIYSTKSLFSAVQMEIGAPVRLLLELNSELVLSYSHTCLTLWASMVRTKTFQMPKIHPLNQHKHALKSLCSLHTLFTYAFWTSRREHITVLGSIFDILICFVSFRQLTKAHIVLSVWAAKLPLDSPFTMSTSLMSISVHCAPHLKWNKEKWEASVSWRAGNKIIS